MRAPSREVRRARPEAELGGAPLLPRRWKPWDAGTIVEASGTCSKTTGNAYPARKPVRETRFRPPSGGAGRIAAVFGPWRKQLGDPPLLGPGQVEDRLVSLDRPASARRKQASGRFGPVCRGVSGRR